MLDWEGLFKRYVWDSDRTPYFTPVDRLTKVQANYELLAYCLFMGVLFTVVAVAALTDRPLFGRSPLVGLYAFSVLAGAIVLHYTKAFPAAVYVALSPAAGLIAVVLYGFDGDRTRPDSLIVLCIMALLLLYAPRVIGIGKRYPDMEEGVEPERRRKLFK